MSSFLVLQLRLLMLDEFTEIKKSYSHVKALTQFSFHCCICIYIHAYICILVGIPVGCWSAWLQHTFTSQRSTTNSELDQMIFNIYGIVNYLFCRMYWFVSPLATMPYSIHNNLFCILCMIIALNKFNMNFFRKGKLMQSACQGCIVSEICYFYDRTDLEKLSSTDSISALKHE